jgi:superfamily II DNA or RNA helicase
MISTLLTVVLSTHNFSVTRLTPRAKEAVLQFIKANLFQYGLMRVAGGKYINAAVKVFAASTEDRQEFRFHINTYAAFLEHMKMCHIPDNLITTTTKPLKIFETVDMPIREGWVAREEQVPAVAYLVEDQPCRARLLELQTGKGKSLVSMLGISAFSKRTAIVIKSMYIEKWIADIQKTFAIPTTQIMVIKGSQDLQSLIIMAKNSELDVKFIIFSNKTILNYLKLYELERSFILEMGYGCLPEDFFETIGCSMRLIDELHQDFHFNFKLDLYTNIERSISLSATMINNDPFMEKMYRLMHPTVTRYVGEPLDKYVIARELRYSIKRDRNYRTTEFNSTIYSHHAFERSILKHPEFKENYCKLILNTVQIGFMDTYKPGQKCIIFCSSIDMCTEVTKFLKNKYPDLLVRRYVEDDPYENLIESDISISTLLSAGTAHDIPNLKTVILTVAINSIQSNVQSLGRLRKLKDTNTYFYYFVCQDIPKHIEYGEAKARMLYDRAASYNLINAPFLI